VWHSSFVWQTTSVIAWMVDQGYLNYSQPVAHYWPEYAQNGKKNVTVRELLEHRGLSNDINFGNLTWDEFLDDDIRAALIAKLPARPSKLEEGEMEAGYAMSIRVRYCFH
jgi:CubicO group peptidase (beta-lactamase class C family)